MTTLDRRHFLLTVASVPGSALTACGGGSAETAGTISTPASPSSAPSDSASAVIEAAPTTPTPPQPSTTVGKLNLTGPSSGLERSLSGLFTVSCSVPVGRKVRVTPSDGAGGQFWSSTSQPGDYGSIYLTASTPTATFLYAPSSAGAKAISLTNDGGLKNPSAYAYEAVTATPGSATPFRLVRGGNTVGRYATLQQVKDQGGWQSGDVVKVTGGTYVVFNPTDAGNTTLVTNTGGVQTGVLVDTTIEWETPGQPMVLDYSRYWQIGMLSGGQPQLLTMGQSCRNLTVRGLHFRGARTPMGESRLGAAIWTTVSTANGAHPAATLTVEYCKFWQCIDGIHTQETHYGLSNYIRYCVFEDNSDPQGLRHDIYTGRNALTYVLGCSFRKTPGQGYPQAGMGHAIKSRSRATTVLACMLDVQMFADGTGGCAQNINTPNGGAVVIAGNVINHYGSLSNNNDGNCLRYGDDQHTKTVDTNPDPSLTVHSLLLAQNTLRKYNGRPADGSDKPLINIYPTGVATMLLSGIGTQVPVTAVVRNNVVASDTARAAAFVTQYPANSEVSLSALSDSGIYTGKPIAGSPAVNDAAFEWVADFTPPAPRSDSNRGGRSLTLPAWVPKVAWQWTEIPGTRWTDYIKNDGSGLAPRITAVDPGPGRSYTNTWEFSGPCYSRKNHEVWMFGGGHAGTTINLLTRYNLHKDLPDVSVVSQPTPEAMRREYALAPNHINYTKQVYWPDGKPYSCHSYTNSFYIDKLDEWLQFGVSACASSVDGVNMSGPGVGSTAVVGFPRNGPYRKAGHWTDLPATGDGVTRGYRSLAGDESGIYYWNRNGTPGLRKFNLATNSYKYISSNTPPELSRPSDEHDGVVFHCGTDTKLGWTGHFCDVLTGTMTPIKFTGPALPAGTDYLLDVLWIASKGYYITVWINSSAVDWGASNVEGNLKQIVIAAITPTSAGSASVSFCNVAGAPPNRCTVIGGVFYDPVYDCLIFPLSYANNLQAIKLS